MAGYSTLIVTVLTTFVLLKLVSTDYLIELRALSYLNSEHRLADGTSCVSSCSNRFDFCLRFFGDPPDGNYTGTDCIFGLYSTGVIGGDNFSFPNPIATGVPNPMNFTGFRLPVAVQLFIRIQHVDPLSQELFLVDNIFITYALAPGPNFTDPRIYDGPADTGAVELSIRSQCTNNFYGFTCDVFCVFTDDESGHYRCNQTNGMIICLSGWSNPSGDCLIPICTAGCHPIGGYCEVPDECLCNSGWTGSLCDQCIPASGCSPVGGFCNLPGDCLCRENYAGPLCDIDVLVCEQLSPCLNGATCANDGLGGYTCTCEPGWTGANCGSEVNECDPDPCLNGATCNDQFNAYECDCILGYTGVICETNIDDCLLVTCLNGGTCEDGIASYTCVCVPGFTGDNCAVDIDECASGLCLNGGTCENEFGGYRCDCVVGYTGQSCTVEIDECEPDPCVNGQCTDEVGGYSCSCDPNWTGVNCDVAFDACDPNPCENGATCSGFAGTFTCNCDPSYTGSRCESMQVKSEGKFRRVVVGGTVAGALFILLIVVPLLILVTGCIMRAKQKKYSKKKISQHLYDVIESWRANRGGLLDHAQSDSDTRGLPDYSEVMHHFHQFPTTEYHQLTVHRDPDDDSNSVGAEYAYPEVTQHFQDIPTKHNEAYQGQGPPKTRNNIALKQCPAYGHS